MPNQLPPIGTGDTDLGEFLRVLSQSVVTSVDGPHVTRTGNSVFVGEALEQETTFMGLIYSASLMSGHGARWVYTMYQAVPVYKSDGPTYERFGDPFTAVNRVEMCHPADPGCSPWIVWGVDVYGSSYPTNFDPQPVGVGHTDYACKVTVVTRPGGSWYEIHEMGPHDGTCD